MPNEFIRVLNYMSFKDFADEMIGSYHETEPPTLIVRSDQTLFHEWLKYARENMRKTKKEQSVELSLEEEGVSEEDYQEMLVEFYEHVLEYKEKIIG